MGQVWSFTPAVTGTTATGKITTPNGAAFEHDGQLSSFIVKAALAPVCVSPPHEVSKDKSVVNTTLGLTKKVGARHFKGMAAIAAA